MRVLSWWLSAVRRPNSRPPGHTVRYSLLMLTLVISALGAADWESPVWPAAWLLAAAMTMVVKFGVQRIDDPLVIVFGIGVLPTVGGLVALPFSQYDVHATTVLLTWVAVQTFLITAVVVGHERQPVFRAARISFNPKFLISVIVTSAFVQMLAFSYYALTRGVPLFAHNAEQARVDASAGAGFVTLILTAAPLLTVAIIPFVHVTKWRHKTALLAVGVLALVLPAFTGSRSALLKVLVVWIVCAYASRRIRHGRVALLSVGAAAIAAVWLIGTIRYAGSEQSFFMLLGQRLAADPYSADLVLHNGINDPRVTGFGLFITAFATYAPGHQPLVGDILRDLVGIDFAGGAIAVPLAAEGWLIAGGTGVALCSFLAAMVPALLSRFADRNKATVVVCSTIFAVTWAGIYGSGFATVLATFALPTVLLLLPIWIGTWCVWHALRRMIPRMSRIAISRDDGVQPLRAQAPTLEEPR